MVDVKRENPVRKVMDLTDGKGAYFVLEAAATQSAMDQAFESVRSGGTIVTIGTFEKPIEFNPFFEMTRREIKLISSIGRTWETWRKMEQIISSGKINFKPLISQKFPLEKFSEAFELAKSKEVMKIILTP